MLSPRGRLRVQRWQDDGEGQPPFTDCLRADIVHASWGCWRAPAELTAAIKRIDPSFELIYDPVTLTPGDSQPAFFIYSVKINRNGLRDALKLEIPLQWDMHSEWPEGRPRAPGIWFIEAYREHDNARHAGSPSYVQKLQMRRKFERVSRNQAEKNKPLIEMQQAIDEELDPYLNNGRLSDALCADSTQIPNDKKRKNWGIPKGPVRVANVSPGTIIEVP